MNFRGNIKRTLKKIGNGFLYDIFEFYYWKQNIISGKLSEKEIHALPMIIKPNDYVIDVGAHFGRFTYPLSKIVGNEGHVYCIEPVYHCFKMLNRIVKTLKLTNVTTYNIALSDKNCEIEMAIPNNQFEIQNFSRSYILNEHRKKDEKLTSTQSIQCQTLDEFVRSNKIPKIDFIKCDIEGAEMLVIKGSENVIKQYHPTLILEIENRHTKQYNYEPHDLLALLYKYGYKIHMFDGIEILPLESIIPEQNNYIFI